jgi:ectoine hydroxylase-related dioxygenase (phytanoyl-CoA dioxygenase family)
VIEALHYILCQSTVKDTVTAILSDKAVLYELSCLISDPGSQRQVMHPDNPYLPGRDDPTLLTCFFALQDVDTTMGPTVYLPRTHTEKAHAAFLDESIAADETESPKDQLLRGSKSVLGTLTKGSCSIYDSRVLHCGSANRSLESRAIFYFSFRNPAVAYPGNPASIREELGSARISLQDLTDAIIATHENGAPNSFAY